jgi:hypothetical protein
MSGDLHVPDEDVAERLDIAITDMWAGYDAVLSGLIDGLATAEARAYAKRNCVPCVAAPALSSST